MTARPILIHVQHLLGIGHLTRTAAITRELGRRGVETVVVLGGMPVPGLDFGAVRVEYLPAAQATDALFLEIVDDTDTPLDDAWRDARRQQLLDLFDSVAPGVVVTELFPFGRSAFFFELIPLVTRARETGAQVVCSVRDILVRKKKVWRYQEMADMAVAHFDRILVHGDPAVIDFDSTFPHMDQIEHLVQYTGYIAQKTAAVSEDGHGEVIVSAGGGRRGEALYRAAVEARALSRLADVPWRLLIGHGVEDDKFAGLAAATRPGIVVERARTDFRGLLDNCRLSVSQAGYNTVTDLLQAETACVLVPYAIDEETEQSLRARYLAERGMASVVPEAGLTPERLAAGVDAALDLPPPRLPETAMDGVRTSADLLQTMAGGGESRNG